MSSLPSPELPRVSVLLPVRNEAGAVRATLDALAAQTYPRERVEVVVADGISDDGTAQIVEEFKRAHPDLAVTLVANVERIYSTGFNRAFNTSAGEVILMLGGHTELAPDYLERGVSYLCAGDFDCVGGTIETVATRWSGRAIARAMSSRFGVGGVAFRTRRDAAAEVDTVAFGMYWRRIFERVGPLDEEMVRNQDDEFNYRLRAAGGRILLAPDLHSRYQSRATFGTLWRQYFGYGLWKVRVLQKHPRQMQPRHFAPAAAVLVGLIAASCAFFFRTALPIALPVLAYVFAAAVTAWRSVRGQPELIPGIMTAYSVLHASYGLGSFVGLWRFRHLWGGLHRDRRG